MESESRREPPEFKEDTGEDVTVVPLSLYYSL